MDINILDKLMKTKLIQFAALAAFLILILGSCQPVPKSLYADFTSNGADFTVTNLTTGEELSNKGLQISVGGDLDRLSVRKGDVLRLTYVPMEKCAEYSCVVTFSVFDETFTLESPHTMEYVVGDVEAGEYTFRCHGEIRDDRVEWMGGGDYGSVLILVEE